MAKKKKSLLDTLKDPKKLFKLVKSPRGIIGILGLGFAFQVMKFGARVGMKGGVKLWVAIGVLVVAIVVIVLLTRREKKKKAEQIEDSLLLEADSLVMTSSGAQRAANEKAREELAEAIDRLKKSKVAGGRSGKTALYELPWYLVLGRGESGKSKVIRNSGLTFPGSGPAALQDTQGVGPGDTCSWWFTNQAVLLETNGRFVDREDDAEARRDWEGVLEVVKKTRGDIPVQGVIVTVSAEDLIRHDASRLEDQARVIRQRLDATVTTLEAFAPVFLVITKVDLLHGFEGFFRDLQGNARDQVLGATLDREQIERGDPVRSFAREFDRLYATLCERRSHRMAGEERAGVRGDIYLFPLELLSIRNKLGAFVKTLFEPNPYGENPMFRGFYFASGSLEGQSVDMVVNEVSRVIGLPSDLGGDDLTRVFDAIPEPEPVAPAQPAAGSDADPRFLRELFTRLLPRSIHLARPTDDALRRARLLRLGGQIAAYAVAGVLAVLMVTSFVTNRSAISGVVDSANEAALIPGGAQNAGEIQNRLRLLEDLRIRLAQFDAWDDRVPFTMGFGLYRGETVNQRARTTYFGRLAEVLLGPSRRELGAQLLTSYPASPGEYQEFFDSYRAYLMMFEPSRADTAFLADQLVRLWNRPGVGAGATEEIDGLIHRHVHYAWQHANEILYHSDKLPGRDPHLTDRAGVYIREFWKPENFYLAMIERVNEAVPAFSVSSVPDGSRLLATDPEKLAENPNVGFVPGAYTLKGWRDEVSARIETSEEQLREDWILREAFEGQPLDMREWMLQTYRKDFVTHWNLFLGAVDVAPSTGVGLAAQRQRDLAGSNSPLVRLLESAATNLRFRGEGENHPLADIETKFSALHQLFAMQGEGEQAFRPLDRFVQQQGGVVESLRQLMESGDPGLTSTQFAKQVMVEAAGVTPGANAIATSVRFADRHCADILDGDPECTEAVRTILRRPAEGAWSAALAEAQLYLDAAWSTDVWEPFQSALTGKYPFNPSGPDAPFAEFSRIFAPDGVFWSFYDQELAPFLDRDGSSRILYGDGMRLGAETAEAIAKAKAYRRALYAEDPGAIGFSFRVKPTQTKRVSGNPPFAQTTNLTIGETRVLYDMGLARDRTVKWPGDAPEAGARLSATMDGPGPGSLDFEGPWAFFRLLDHAQVDVRSDSDFLVRWKLDRAGAYTIEVPYEFRATSSVNPLQPGFFDFTCPRQIGPPPGGES